MQPRFEKQGIGEHIERMHEMNKRLEDYNVPQFLDTPLIEKDIVRFNIFFRKVKDVIRKNVLSSSGESQHHINLKALAYYELKQRYSDATIEYESAYGFGRIDVACFINGVPKIAVEVGNTNVSVDNVLRRGLNTFEEVWMIPYQDSDIVPIYSFSRGKYWKFYESIEENRLIDALRKEKPYASFYIGTERIPRYSYYFNEREYIKLEELSKKSGFSDPTLYIFSLLKDYLKKVELDA